MEIRMKVAGVSRKYGVFYPGTKLEMPETQAKRYLETGNAEKVPDTKKKPAATSKKKPAKK